MKTLYELFRIVVSLSAGFYILYLGFEYKSEDMTIFIVFLSSSMICFSDLYIPFKKLLSREATASTSPTTSETRGKQ
jgi:hypothetical protein